MTLAGDEWEPFTDTILSVCGLIRKSLSIVFGKVDALFTSI